MTMDGDSPGAADAGRAARLDAHLRASARRTRAPQALRDAVRERYGAELGDARDPRPATRRSLLFGAAGAAAAAATTFAVMSLLRPPPGRDLVSTFRSDFETYLLKDRAVDFATTDPAALAAWFDARLPFTLSIRKDTGDGAHLLGGRLCWLLDRRLASLSYRRESLDRVLYVMQGDDLRASASAASLGDAPTVHAGSAGSVVTWKNAGLLHVLTGSEAPQRLLSTARRLAGGTAATGNSA